MTEEIWELRQPRVWSSNTTEVISETLVHKSCSSPLQYQINRCGHKKGKKLTYNTARIDEEIEHVADRMRSSSNYEEEEKAAARAGNLG